MIIFLSLCFFGIVYLLVKLKLLPWNGTSRGIVIGIYVTALILLVVAMNLFQPYTPAAVVMARTTPIISRVTGRVIEVPIKANVPIKEGEVLLRIDPAPYEAEVDRLKAELAAAEQRVPQLNAAVDAANAALEYAELDLERQRKAATTSAVSQDAVDRAAATRDVREADLVQAKLAASSEIDGVNTDVARLRAALRRAEIDLKETTIYAPADGKVTQLIAREGTVTNTMPFAAVMNFIYDEPLTLSGGFSARSLRHIKPGDPVELAFESQPGKIHTGKVVVLARGTGEGALTPDGNLLTAQQLLNSSPLGAVRIQLDEEAGDIVAPFGTRAAAAIYTDKGKSIAIIRKIIIRMTAWRNYL